MVINVGKIIKTCRNKANMSQEELAHATNLTQSTVSRLERNIVSCEVNTFTRIVQATGTQDTAITMLFGADALTSIITTIPMFTSWINIFI